MAININPIESNVLVAVLEKKADFTSKSFMYEGFSAVIFHSFALQAFIF